jgi:hypothetical protein
MPATPERTVLAISKRQSFVIEISFDLRIGRKRRDWATPSERAKAGLGFINARQGAA